MLTAVDERKLVLVQGVQHELHTDEGEDERDPVLEVGELVDEVAEQGLPRVPGTAVFLFKGTGAAPPALITNTRHNHVLHERVVLLSVVTDNVPVVDDTERIELDDFGHGVFQVVVHYGFMEEPDVEAALLKLSDDPLPLTADELTFFLGRETVIASSLPGMADWRERLFAIQLRSAASAARFFRLPADRVVEVGSQVEI